MLEAQPSTICPQDAQRMQEVFLPVHGHVKLFPEEVAIVNHPAFQRLRRVRQLGFAHMVFPGGTHTRFEHSIGAVYVAQVIIDHVNENFDCKGPDSDGGVWKIIGIDRPTTRFIRLAALLHDVGHLPFGHTLEDELNHLRSHDGEDRLLRVAGIQFPNHEVDKAVLGDAGTPDGGWNLHDLVNGLYGQFTNELHIPDEPFTVLSHIVCKPPKEVSRKEQWLSVAGRVRQGIHLDLCRDIVGNTICADFLDYLYRDWHHLGKPLYVDKRLYQYMEVRQQVTVGNGSSAEPKFVINVGAPERIRHDALTDILELLNARYKLAEIVLFHRTKLSLTGLLDRCLLEIRELYRQVGLSESEFLDSAESLLIEGSDDGLPLILRKLAAGGTGPDRRKVRDAIDAQKQQVEASLAAPTEQPNLLTGLPERPNDSPDQSGHPVPDRFTGQTEHSDRSGLQAEVNLVEGLIARLRDRDVYTLAWKLRMSHFPPPHDPDNARLNKLLEIYRIPKNRLDFLEKIELLCGLPRGSVIMYCPHDATMNAKIAKVKLFIEGEVSEFDKYEEGQKDASLTRGALWAQIHRFYELWSAQIYVERRTWDGLSAAAQSNLKAVLRGFFFLMDQSVKPDIVRNQLEYSVQAVHSETRAARGGKGDPTLDRYKGFRFPSGLPFLAG